MRTAPALPTRFRPIVEPLAGGTDLPAATTNGAATRAVPPREASRPRPTLHSPSLADRWATFDCYGTLIDWDGGVGVAMAALWPDADSARLLRAYHAVEPLAQEGRAVSYRQVLERSLRAVGAIEGLSLDEDDASALSDSLPSWPPFPDVAPALQALRSGGVGLAILSNTDPDLLDASLARIGVPVDAIVTAADAGSYKPARGHWETFFGRTGATRERCVHVAASPFHDLAPASEMGLTAVWINRTGELASENRAAELPTLEELPATVDRLVPA
jgi:2-haloacid dehalogenase